MSDNFWAAYWCGFFLLAIGLGILVDHPTVFFIILAVACFICLLLV